MAELSQIKVNFREDLVRWGVEHPEDRPKLGRWFREMTRRSKPEWNSAPRLANRFTLGLDANLGNLTAGGLTSARQVGVSYHGFFGVDPIENFLFKVRLAPTRSVLALVASMWRVLEYSWALGFNGRWISEPYIQDSMLSMGAHLHLGKLRDRIQTAGALDAAYTALHNAGLWNKNLQLARQRGDCRYRKFGHLGDVRRKNYGLEYRTLPSCMRSPEQMMVVLTTMKLAALSPGMLVSWHQQDQPGIWAVRNLLAYWQGLDDDARLAYWLLTVPWKNVGTLEANWNLTAPTIPKPLVHLLPAVMGCEELWAKGMWEHLVEGKALKAPEEKRFWNPKVPVGYMLLKITHPEMAQKFGGLASNRGLVLTQGDQPGVRASRGLLTQEQIQKAQGIVGMAVTEAETVKTISVNRIWWQENPSAEQKLRRVLKEVLGCFEAAEEDPPSSSAVPERPKRKKYSGDLLFSTDGAKPRKFKVEVQ